MTARIEYKIVHGGTIGGSWYTIERRAGSDAAGVWSPWVPVPRAGTRSTETPPRINPARFRFTERVDALLVVRRQIAADHAAAARLGLVATTHDHDRDHALVATVTVG